MNYWTGVQKIWDVDDIYGGYAPLGNCIICIGREVMENDVHEHELTEYKYL